METIPTFHALHPQHPASAMLVLPNMDPTHRTHSPPSLPRAFLLRLFGIATRLSILTAKIIGTALAMFLVSRMIHTPVLCLDDLYEVLGRRAASTWETRSFSGYGTLVGLLVMAMLHCLLGRVGYSALLEEDLSGPKEDGMDKSRRKVTWERVLMRLVTPLFLYGGFCVMIWDLWQRGAKREFVRANTVDLTDDDRAGLVWRDR